MTTMSHATRSRSTGSSIAARGGGHAIGVERGACAVSLGAKHMSRVAGTLNGHPFRSNVVKMGGGMLLGVHKANVEALGSDRRAIPSRS